MTKHDAFQATHEQYIQRINNILSSTLHTIEPSLLKEAMNYSLLAGGKRIRPFLVYATGQMFLCELKNLDAPAAAIEAIHTYSLIHDDLPCMDNDDLRRGQPTCHIKFDEATAVLAGDALQTHAFSLLANAPALTDSCKVLMIAELAKASGAQGMCLGQHLDLQAEGITINLQQLDHIHLNKTAALIQAAVSLGILAAGQDALRHTQPLMEYATCIGLAFQVQDDVLDVIGDKHVMGKNQGTDHSLAKNTYTSLIGLEKSIETSRHFCKLAIEALDKIPYNTEMLRQLADFIIVRQR